MTLITSFLTQGLEKEPVNYLCCYNETNDKKSQINVKCDRLKHNAFSEHTSMINTSIVYSDISSEYEVISTKIKKSLLKAEIITWASLEHSKQPAVFPNPNFLNKVSIRPTYPSSKKVKDYDKLEVEVKKNRRMISLKETLFAQSTGGIYWDSAFNKLERLVLRKSRALFMMIWRSRHEKYDLI
ncbi:hypothetical protein HID58_022721 [Brassica napus]|uniref:Uncharacterized protein n=1 Tax=Brassica napus TaxID=3708 RepID=A0ABQ8D1Q0_BRANA|nr:hypothetical protein HID58_022721 [Brassica napus]